MSDPRVVVVVVIVVALVAVAGWVIARSGRRRRLQEQFGPEYPRAVRKYGSVTRAESALAARRERVRRLDIRPLRLADAERFAAAWRDAQARFVEEPSDAIVQADRLVQEVMHARGYPVGDFDERVDDVSVDHPTVVEHYRTAHEIAVASGDGRTTTEDLRQAMRHYRALFEDLLDIDDEPPRRMEAGR